MSPPAANPRRRFNLVYDFDGTLLPMGPWDSEQELLLAWMQESRPPAWRRRYFRLVAEGDRRGWLRRSFKWHYLRLLRGAPQELLERVTERLAARIPPEDRAALREQRDRGHRLLVASCGTADLSERVLEACGVRACFEAVLANRFVFREGRVAGLRLEVPSGQSKVQLLESLHLDPADTVSIGDGATDLPLWEWSAVPVVLDRTGAGRARFGAKSYHFVSATPGVLELLEQLGG
jgi:phosphoserine phosphatase